jgi:hypothetical protein
MLVAFIFSLIAVIGWLIAAALAIIGYVTIAAAYAAYGVDALGLGIFGLITGIVYLVFMVLEILVFLRVWKMYKAANAGDIATLKAKTSILWGIIALIFGFVITGIMLLIADGPIKQLEG